MHWVQRLMPFTYQRRGGGGEPQYVLGLNFGEVELDWERRALRVALRGTDGHVIHGAPWIDMDALGSAAAPAAARGGGAHEASAARWDCVGHRGAVDARHAKARFALAIGSLLLLLLGLPLGGACCLACAAWRCLCAPVRWRRAARRALEKAD